MEKIKLDEITKLIKEQIKNFKNKVVQNDFGSVFSVSDNIVLIYGLNDVMLNELLIFKNNIYGMVMSLNINYVGAIVFDNNNSIKEGDFVKRSNKVIEVPVGDEILGRVVNALIQPIDNSIEINANKFRKIENLSPKIIDHHEINEPLETGIKIIDNLIPIGKGQRELIIGDSKTGKTAIAIDTIINQKNKNVKCIYVSIGQKNSSVLNIYQKLEEYEAIKYTTIIDAPSDNLAFQYIAPYSAMAVAEEWAENGDDVLIIFDDLSKHAMAYRSISLLLKRPSGREAYPGDIFYLHSRLLERSCKFKNGSITALPIVETQMNDISSYIPTNIISITDGQIFLSSDNFNMGIKPAINIDISVSRIGSNAQFKMIKKVSKKIKTKIANYHELLAFYRFNSSIDDETKKIINHGAVLTEIFKQDQYCPLSCTKQAIELYAVENGYFDHVEISKLPFLIKEFHKFFEAYYRDVIDFLDKEKDLTPAVEMKLNEGIEKFFNTLM